MDAASDFVKQLFRKSERYEVIDLVGQGGMGQVYKAIDRELDEVVALKVLKPRLSSDPTVISRFKQEIKLTRKIKHKNVARIFDLGEIGGFKFISMEYIDGKSLKDVILSRGQLPLDLALHLYRQILEGVAAAHDEGIVHRDIKPQNVMVSRDWTAFVLDFGIARSVESEDLFQVGVLVGSPAYMSTEQALRKEVDHRSDVYSLGVMLFELLTGQPPFRARSLVAAANKHVTESPPDPRTLRPEVPAWTAALILRCLEKDPAARWQSIREMLAEIESNAAASDTLADETPVALAGMDTPPHPVSGSPAGALPQSGPRSTSAVVDAASGGPSPAARVPAAVAPPRPRALVAEADPETATTVRAKLESLGLEVDQVPDGVAAVDRAVGERFDVILLGSDLPRLDGIEATRILRNYAATREVPIVILLASAQSAQESFAFDSGATDVVSKPVNAAALTKKTRALLDL